MGTREHCLKRVKAILPGSSKLTDDHSKTTTPATPKSVKKLLRLMIGDPWKEYEYIQDLGQVILARHKASYFKIVNIQQFHCVNPPIEESQILSSAQHPNVASIYDVYWSNNTNFLIIEHLHIGIAQLELEKYQLEEWEIANVSRGVMRGMA
jgi:hypothetical protein